MLAVAFKSSWRPTRFTRSGQAKRGWQATADN